MPFFGLKQPICPEQNIFGTSHYYHFHLPFGPFHCAKFKKNSYSGSRVIRMRLFRALNGPLAQTNYFLKKKYWYHFHLPIGPFHCEKFLKKSNSGFRVKMMRHFWAKNDPFAQIRFFFRKPVKFVPFIHAYLHVKNQSEILVY